MKHIDIFNDFLRDTVNLNDTRVKELETSIGSIKDTVRASVWEPRMNGWMEQGSWAHKTIIKPVDQGEFDADLIVFIQPVNGWEAKEYINTLYNVFRDSSIYRDKVNRWSHCVTLTYANDKKIDVAPCIVDRYGVKGLEVCNRDNNDFERTEPCLYTDWLIAQNALTKNNSFRKVTRLLKYLRDIKKRFSCPSVLLTTILGYRISSADHGSILFADVPTALKTLVGRMDDWLQAQMTKPIVTNPYLTDENFADAWTEDQYKKFRDNVHIYREWIDDAYEEHDRDESIIKWRRVFGEEFAAGIVNDEGRTAGSRVVSDLRRSVIAASFVGDLVDLIRMFGGDILPASFNRQPYMEAPRWKAASVNQRIAVTVRAELYRTQVGTQRVKEVQSFEPLPAGYWLRFKASTNAGSPFLSADYTVMWRVTNTDEVAARAKALRGRFEKPESDNGRWEELRYRGVHLVEAFIIRKRDNQVVGQSDVFHVMIE